MRMLWVKCVSFEQKAEFFSSQKKARHAVSFLPQPRQRVAAHLPPPFRSFLKATLPETPIFAALPKKTARRFAFTVRLAEKKASPFFGEAYCIQFNFFGVIRHRGLNLNKDF